MAEPVILPPQFEPVVTPLCSIEPLETRWEYPNRGGAIYFASLLVQPCTGLLPVIRPQGAVSGAHFHRGRYISKTPETFYLFSGKMKLELIGVESREERSYVIEPHCIVRIPPLVHHTFRALEGGMGFIELLVEEDGKSNFDDDTIKGPLPDLESALKP